MTDISIKQISPAPQEPTPAQRRKAARQQITIAVEQFERAARAEGRALECWLTAPSGDDMQEAIELGNAGTNVKTTRNALMDAINACLAEGQGR